LNINENPIEEIKAAGDRFGYPLMLKSKKLAYDGRGNAVISSPDGRFFILYILKISKKSWI